jgi:hypothetical protein
MGDDAAQARLGWQRPTMVMKSGVIGHDRAVFVIGGGVENKQAFPATLSL